MKTRPAPKPDARVSSQMRWVGLALYFTGCMGIHKDGDSIGCVFRPWHPVTWLLLVAMVIPCAIVGEPLFSTVPLRLSKFWTDNMGQFQRVKPWTKLSALQSFRFAALVRSTND